MVSPFITSGNLVASGDMFNVGTRASIALSKLLRLHPFAMQDPTSRMAVNSAMATLRAMGPKVESSVLALEDTIRESLDHIARHEKLSASHRAIFGSDNCQVADLLSVDLHTLASQMTLVEQRFMEAVSVPDLMKSAWTKRDTAVSSWVSHSNDISRWLASRILQQPKRKDRAKLISRLIRLAEMLKDLNNFSSMLTVFLTLSMECVSRLRKTWDWNNQILLDQFAKLKEDIRPMQNFSGYRDLLKKALAPCIPYLAVLMRDMVMLEEVLSQPPSDSDQTESLFNFSHLETVTRVLHSQFVQFSKARFSFEEDPLLYREILNPTAFDLIDEDALMDTAKQVEPDKSKSLRQHSLPRLEVNLKRSASSTSSSEPSVRSYTEYGVRSMVTPRSLASPRAESKSSSNFWKRQATLFASACESAASALSDVGKLRVAQTALSLSDLFAASLKGGDSPVSSERFRPSTALDGAEVDVVSIPSFVKDMTCLLSQISELRCSWESTHATSTFKAWFVTMDNTYLIIAIVMQSIKGAQSLFPTEPTFSARVAVSLLDQVEKLGQRGSFSFTLQVPSQDFDTSSLESTILDSFGPPMARAFSSFDGRLTHGVSGMYHSTITISIIVPLTRA
jgi:hypothetical protein